MTTLHEVRVLAALLLLSVLALAGCGSSTEPTNCVEVRAQVGELRAQATLLRGVARTFRDMPGGADTYRGMLAIADHNERLAATLAVPECAPYPSAP